MSQLYPFNKEDAEFFKDVVFLVEATHFEQMELWRDFHNNPTNDRPPVPWKEICAGKWFTIGECDNRPVCIEIFWAIIYGRKVMFYHSTSQVVDHDMIEKWLRHFGANIKWDHGTRWAHCDAMNFAHCVEACQRTDEERLIPRSRNNSI